MIDNRRLGRVIQLKMKEKYDTYEKLDKGKIISKTYLTDVIANKKIPSREVIDRLTKRLEIDPLTLKEYRILRIEDILEKNFKRYKEEDIKRIEEALIVEGKSIKELDKSIYQEMKKDNPFRERNREDMDTDNWVDISNLPKKYRKIILTLYKELKDIALDEVIDKP